MRTQPFSRLQRGSSLVEVLVAMLLMSFGVLAMTSLQAHAIQHSHTTDTRARATLLGHDLADRMRANVSPSGDWSAYELTALATSSITSTTLSGACEGNTACTFAEMAAYDLAQWQQQLVRSLPQGRGHVRIVGAQADIWVLWEDPDEAGAQAHDLCPAGLIMAAHTRCLYLRTAL